ncbi:hypothetical protein D9615_002211 [Tricholomella constricta]|uniref:DNA breaking-rejoining enzyme n=1 Tax=Tricholomella constricta TaxID=117010 RepID=A0A8H5M980_9AGAR|nr:hypothetical protein D9615_002211 [Tricholomella constricta]
MTTNTLHTSRPSKALLRVVGRGVFVMPPPKSPHPKGIMTASKQAPSISSQSTASSSPPLRIVAQGVSIMLASRSSRQSGITIMPARNSNPRADSPIISLPPPPSLSLSMPTAHLADASISSSFPRLAAAQHFPFRHRRLPSSCNTYQSSSLHPPVLADQHILLWTAPYSHRARSSLDKVSPCLQSNIFECLLESVSDSTRQSYGAGLLRFTQFCDREHIAEHQRMPASEVLLSAFVADAAGTCSGECIRNWLNADKLGSTFRRPPRNPITGEHLYALHQKLDLWSPFGAAVWATALTAFWGCRRLGELLPQSATSYSPITIPLRSAPCSTSFVDGKKVITIHLPWTKTTTFCGGECILTATGNIFCPVTAIKNYLRINNISSSAPFFAFSDNAHPFSPLTKSSFLQHTSAIFSGLRLEPVFGHRYCIRGSLELLAAGVAPEVIMKLGGWSSLCFLTYWRRLNFLVPSAIIRTWEDNHRHFAEKHHLPYL